MKKKKKVDKHESTHETIAPSTYQFGTPSTPSWKVKFHCKLCKGDHLLRDCPGISRILEVWSHDLACPHRPLKLKSMFNPQLEVVRRKGRFDSPIGYVKVTIPFTFVHSWIKLPLFWKVL